MLLFHPTISQDEQKQFLAAPPKFSDFADCNGYDGFVVTAGYLRTVWVDLFLHGRAAGAPKPDHGAGDGATGAWSREGHLHRVAQLVDGDVWGEDASFKFSKCIR